MGGLKEFPVIWRADAAISNAPLKAKKYVAALNELWLVRFSLLPHWNSLSRVEQSCQRHPITAVVPPPPLSKKGVQESVGKSARSLTSHLLFSQCVPFSFFKGKLLISTFQSGANRVATYTENEFPYNYALACMDESRCFLFFSASDSLNKSYSFCWGGCCWGQGLYSLRWRQNIQSHFI